MFIRVEFNISDFGEPVAPLELFVFDDAGCEAVTPARIDFEVPADIAEAQLPLVRKAGLFLQLAGSSVRMRFPIFEAAGHRLPEIEGLASPEQKDLRVVGEYDDKYGYWTAKCGFGHLRWSFGAWSPQPNTGFLELFGGHFAWRVG